MIGSFIALAVSAALVPSLPIADFRAGDAGFSIRTAAGETWLYGDSWDPNGRFIRNAVTLDGRFTGTIEGGPAEGRGGWIWPGTPFKERFGQLAMYAPLLTRPADGSTGPWSFRTAGSVRVDFDPARPAAARVTPMPSGPVVWSAAAAADPASGAQLVFGTDVEHVAHVAEVGPSGQPRDLGSVGGPIADQFTVLEDPTDGSWWMVGCLPLLSRRVVAYPLTAPAGKVAGPAVTLITLPDPGPLGYVYAATVHPELNGLLTWAVNGTSPGAAYGLRRQAGFWPGALHFAESAAQGARQGAT